MLCLPPEWDIDADDYDPIGSMKMLARLPHDYATWLGYGHTIPNGDPATALASNATVVGMMLGAPTIAGEDFARLETPNGDWVNFYALSRIRSRQSHLD